MLNVLYLVHDLCDPAVRRRVTMLQIGGAAVTLAGFRRAETVPDFEDLSPIDLGVTADRAFAQRVAAVAKAAFSLGARLATIPKPDIIIGRNLEMLALANRARSIFGGSAPIVYECLDIHRFLLDTGAVGRTLRGAERLFSRDAQLLLTSSPAFVRDYFEAFGQTRVPAVLLQNKILDLSGKPAQQAKLPAPPADGEPWKIGWFGALRCAKSLELLAAFTRRMQGRFEVVLRGRPARVEFNDFDGFVRAEPYLSFQGAYRNPDDLAAIYGEVHFCWAIDFFEEGLNSSWLLPNRLYEGCRFGAVPIAIKGTETARFLSDRHIGLLLDEPSVENLSTLVGDIDADAYLARRGKITAQDLGTWICVPDDCRSLVARLGRLAGKEQQDTLLEVAA
ncbi:glycosyl transferase family 1 [Mesorhizobium loti]|nr:glycosyl transferase family 1 [Mesorhizobium loti]PLP60182.1 glycosyl transferase family 1 [Mesorhizobium loti]